MQHQAFVLMTFLFLNLSHNPAVDILMTNGCNQVCSAPFLKTGVFNLLSFQSMDKYIWENGIVRDPQPKIL